MSIFSPESKYKKQARYMAMLWTLLIFIGCFTPSKELPKVDVPLIDKWVHFVLFGGFSFLWLCAYPARKISRFLTVFFCGAALGALIEVLQGVFVSLGRSCEFMDAVADSIGALLGILIFFSLTPRSPLQRRGDDVR